MGFKKYLDTDRANEVPELRDFAKYQTEIDNLKTLCVIIREEEKKFLIETKEEERNKSCKITFNKYFNLFYKRSRCRRI